MVDHQKQLEEAYQLQQQGRLDDAERLYEKLIKNNPRNYDALHFLGVLKAQLGQFEEATQLIRRSLATKSVNLRYLENYASILFQIGNYEQAFKVCTSVDESKRTDNLRYLLAISAHKVGRFTEALSAFDSLLQHSPTHLAGNNEKAATLAELKRYEEALAYVDKALEINPRYAEAYLNKGNILISLKKYNESAAAYEKALLFNGNLREAYLGLAYAYRQLNFFDRAQAVYARVLAGSPNFAEAWIGRGNTFIEMDRFGEAVAAYDKALSVNRQMAAAWEGRANALLGLKDPEQALQSFDQLAALDPGSAAAWLGRGKVFVELKRYADASAAYDNAIRLDPNLADAYFCKAVLKLCVGDFASGWDLYEWRSEAKEYVSNYPHLKAPNVVSRQERTAFIGKRIAVLAEQGVGDEIMFASMLPDLVEDAKTVLHQSDPRLVGLFRTAFPSVNTVAKNTTSNEQIPEEDVDMVIQAGSLGYAYRRDVTSFPRLPYLKADSTRVDKWQARLLRDAESRLRIGISWRGGAVRTRRDDRSIDLERLRPLIEREDAHFVSLQYGDVREELTRFNLGSGKVHSLLDDFNDFDEFAALITALDLVISVQNTTIHMCGALGKACWGMIPWRPEWRYGVRDKEMIWYSSIDLFRQERRGDWSSVINLINSNLTALIGEQENGQTA
jgi:tetratricopeptide (TPR) repeat protein